MGNSVDVHATVYNRTSSDISVRIGGMDSYDWRGAVYNDTVLTIPPGGNRSIASTTTGGASGCPIQFDEERSGANIRVYYESPGWRSTSNNNGGVRAYREGPNVVFENM